ncbi:MAG: recombinase family protein [Candidatus Limivivens sp.]|nr:recombinase family protein [Candidatus Limivivens sp.]
MEAGKCRIGAAYIRVSTEDQTEYSPDSQLKMIRKYAKGADIELSEEFIFLDEGISGRSAEKRPGFLRMVGLAKQKPRPFDVILLWKFSRFARSRQDSILYKSMLRKECGIEVISITEQLSDDPTSILIEALLEAMDEYYSINLAQEVRRGMNEKFSRGGVVSIPPFGYRMGEGCFEIDSEKAALVRMIYADFLNGESYRRIAEKLNEMGVRSNRGNLFESRTVEYILSNPVYLGKLRRNLEGHDPTDRFHQGERVTVVDGEHEPLLEEEIFQKAQERIREIRRSHGKNARVSDADFMLRGLVRCSDCGSVLTRTAGGKALQCCKYARGQCRVSHYAGLERLNRAVLDRIKMDFTGADQEICISVKKREKKQETAEIMLERERKRLERVKEAYLSGIDSLEEYQQKKTEMIRKIEKIRQSQNKRNGADIEKKNAAARPEKKDAEARQEESTKNGRFVIPLDSLADLLGSGKISEAAKNEILRAFVTKIVFSREQGTICIFYGSSGKEG